jgi:hypothetical protein
MATGPSKSRVARALRRASSSDEFGSPLAGCSVLLASETELNLAMTHGPKYRLALCGRLLFAIAHQGKIVCE